MSVFCSKNICKRLHKQTKVVDEKRVKNLEGHVEITREVSRISPLWDFGSLEHTHTVSLSHFCAFFLMPNTLFLFSYSTRLHIRKDSQTREIKTHINITIFCAASFTLFFWLFYSSSEKLRALKMRCNVYQKCSKRIIKIFN